MITTQSCLFNLSEEGEGAEDQQKRKRPAAAVVKESEENVLLAPVKRRLAEYTKDVPLNPLSSDKAQLFFGTSLVCIAQPFNSENVNLNIDVGYP